MIISASYKTDIPTFYGQWFVNRLRAGYCKTLNPYNLRISRVSLQTSDVDGFVFWTKNIGPFLKYLPEVRDRKLPFVVQHTINAYPRQLEHSVVDAPRSIENLRRVSEEFGPRVAVWRYDTIILSTLTSRDWHLKTFSSLASQLEGVTDEVVVSFAHLYQKTQRNMDLAAKELNFEWSDPSEDWKRDLLTELTVIAASHGIQATLCSQPQFLVPGAREARCVDAERFSSLSDHRVRAKLKGNRKECGCYEAKDIGDYDTCPHGCVYCYAVRNQALAQQRYREHDPESELLFPPPPNAVEVETKPGSVQLSLFDDM